MDVNSKFVITINREFGSAGHEIGSAIAKKLGVRMVDKEVVNATAAKFDVSEDKIGRVEKRKPSWWDDFAEFYKSFMDMKENHVDQSDITSRQLFVAESRIISDIATHESCIVIGRSGFDIFKDTPNSLKIFLHADLDYRVERIMNMYGLDQGKALQMIDDNDYQREQFTKTFTGKSRYDSRNYDICLNSGVLGVQETVNAILGLIKL